MIFAGNFIPHGPLERLVRHTLLRYGWLLLKLDEDFGVMMPSIGMKQAACDSDSFADVA